VANPAQEDADDDGSGDHCDAGDSDGDGYADLKEARFIGTAADQPCGTGWPSNLWNEDTSFNKLEIQDITSFLAPVRRLNTSPGDEPRFHPRWDLEPGPVPGIADHISINDIAELLHGDDGSPAFPPMFGGARAFGKTCPTRP
jgi:hypothetical protein